MEKTSKIFIAGHNGLVGSAIVRALTNDGYTNLVLRTRSELDLLDTTAVNAFMQEERPEYLFLAAAKVGGIMANATYPAEFMHSNILIQDNVIHASYQANVKKLLFLGSSCIYPKFAAQPITEDSFLTGPLEETNRAYAVAKIAGIVECQSYNAQYGTNYISVMPTNLYGPGDNFDLVTSHVLPALIAKFHNAKETQSPSVGLWGSGSARREFLHVDDLARACVFLMNTYDSSDIINIGTGVDVSIKELAELVRSIVGFTGTIEWDHEKPDGTPRKLLDVHRLHDMGWKHTTGLEEGVRSTYAWYVRERAGKAS